MATLGFFSPTSFLILPYSGKSGSIPKTEEKEVFFHELGNNGKVLLLGHLHSALRMNVIHSFKLLTYILSMKWQGVAMSSMHSYFCFYPLWLIQSLACMRGCRASLGVSGYSLESRRRIIAYTFVSLRHWLYFYSLDTTVLLTQPTAIELHAYVSCSWQTTSWEQR